MWFPNYPCIVTDIIVLENLSPNKCDGLSQNVNYIVFHLLKNHIKTTTIAAFCMYMIKLYKSFPIKYIWVQTSFPQC